MREIKFRAWIIKENKMVQVDSICRNKGYGGALQIMVDNEAFNPIKQPWQGDNRPHDSYINHSMQVHKDRNNGDDFILMQYTGLKDKKGVEIYEGDIVKSWNMLTEDGLPDLCEVVWDKNFYGIKRINGNGYTGLHFSDGEFGVEVVGNIYEKPQLLEAK